VPQPRRVPPTTHRPTIVLAGVAVVAIGLVAPGGQAISAQRHSGGPALNRMEHEAHRNLTEARREQARVLNPREHLAHRDLTRTSGILATVPASPGDDIASRSTASA
jgi:hypothetical protein